MKIEKLYSEEIKTQWSRYKTKRNENKNVDRKITIKKKSNGMAKVCKQGWTVLSHPVIERNQFLIIFITKLTTVG